MTDPRDPTTPGAADLARAHYQVGRLRAALRESQARVQELEQRLAALEASAALQFGRLVAGAARNPRRRAPRLPRELYRLWKKRHAPASAAASATARESRTRVQVDRVERPEDRLLVAAPCERVVIAGILGRAAAAALADHVKIVHLYPHDARLVLDAADVDMVVVDAAAGEPGGPWAYLGTPGVYDREQVLHEVRELARLRGLPLVLWGEAPPPGLAVLDWDARTAAAARLAELAPTFESA
ncbi:hypothetical protein Arub01_00030 [Actinomadura rubrobrunea]|uniref:Uncharacterized protein n=1 Tax=Actinomadura rubrobrunea TaxID=115335 RepID=A0A9W6USN1_9ACTN|nr:hypothetical protein [Actinomadura rubrobrunea]GLW61759.1 hypothetical protein Arub01_00030 [Actinomadura rubrobrunea]